MNSGLTALSHRDLPLDHCKPPVKSLASHKQSPAQAQNGHGWQGRHPSADDVADMGFGAPQFVGNFLERQYLDLQIQTRSFVPTKQAPVYAFVVLLLHLQPQFDHDRSTDHQYS
jgi:hypothetical protein